MRLKTIFASALLAAATTLVAAAPAQAAEPTCNAYAAHFFEDLSEGKATYVPDYGGSINCRLDEGDGAGGKNWGVVGLQRNINQCYARRIESGSPYAFAPIQEDGNFGPNTKAALIKVQKYINSELGNVMPADGGYGPKTRAYMHYFQQTTGFCSMISLDA